MLSLRGCERQFARSRVLNISRLIPGSKAHIMHGWMSVRSISFCLTAPCLNGALFCPRRKDAE